MYHQFDEFALDRDGEALQLVADSSRGVFTYCLRVLERWVGILLSLVVVDLETSNFSGCC